ncbi:ArsR/SmtB family transcription factor [Kitasatospora sp. NPDC004745]|uniref:ArsR/SmtB family transcription factor n=1 Tax=Kitasatospora sp. NPDC004745 TaxID=3364019 RepID=UPI003683E7A8
MLHLDLDRAVLANTRFAISPLANALGVLWLLRGDARAGRARPAGDARAGGWRGLVRETVRERRLVLLDALFTDAGDYVPDFLTPQPEAPEASVQDELHAVATTGSARLRWELDVMTRGIDAERLTGRATVPVPLRDALERGEQEFAERAAAELQVLWDTALAPHWSALRARLETDITHRARTAAFDGLSGMLSTLHPRVSLADGRLHLITRLQGRIPDTTGLVLTPSAFATDLRLVIDSVPAPATRLPMFAYPARSGPGPGGGSPVRDLLGVTRARLLTDLRTARTTAELGERHFLAASTVSYHLGILHRTGLITRTRTGQRVLYEQTPRAADLLTGTAPC